jgi:hypothetical protein
MMTNNTFIDLSIVEELDFNNVPNGYQSNAFVFLYIKDRIGNTLVDMPAYARVVLGGKNSDGSEHLFTQNEVSHEAGHGVGFTGHATSNNSIMFQGNGPSSPTSIDIQNGTILYNRPVNNTSPDNDPFSAGLPSNTMARSRSK